MEYQFLELYQKDGQVYGQFISAGYFTILQKEHIRSFKLPGKAITQFFVVSDHAIRSEDALDFIARIETGRVVYHHIDLSSLERVKGKTKW